MKIVHLMAGLGAASGVANVARRFARVQFARGDRSLLLAPAIKWNPIYFGLVFAVRAFAHACSATEIWVHCSWTFPVWFGAALAKAFRKKLVVVPEGSFDPKRMSNHAGWKKRLVAPLDRWVLRQADEVLALCRDEIEWVKGFEPSAKVRFERVPIFLPNTAEKVKSKREEVKSAADCSFHVLFLGRAEDPLKGVRFLKRAVKELNGEAESFPLQKKEEPSLLGSGKDSASPLFQLRIVSDHFGEELEQDWDWCDVLCLPTLSENFGLVVAEALERGKRVVTTDGAPAWEPPPEAAEVKVRGEGEQWTDRLSYVRGYRDGTDGERVELLKEALEGLTGKSC